MAEVIDRLFDTAVKTCSRCKTSGPVDEFHKNKNMADGRASACKACLKAAVIAGAVMTYECVKCGIICEKKSKGAHKFCEPCAADVRRERDRARRPRTIVGFPRTCEICSCDFEVKGGKQTVCPGCIKTVNADRVRNWSALNRDSIRAAAKRYNDKRRSTPRGHLEWTIRAAVSRSIKQGAKSGRRTFDLLGYTADDLKAHLEKQFHGGMSWDNYGEWHIDHRLPLASFSYETPECQAFKEAWALSNLQPLWAVENMSKGARLIYLV